MRRLAVVACILAFIAGLVSVYVVGDMPFGAPDFYRPYYMIRGSTCGGGEYAYVDPDQTVTLIEVSGRGTILYLRFHTSGANSDKDMKWEVEVDGKIITAFWDTVQNIRYHYDKHTPVVQLLRDDTANNIYCWAISLRMPFKQGFKIRVWNTGNESHPAIAYAVYELVEELREPP